MARFPNSFGNREKADAELDPQGFSSLQMALGFCALGALGALLVAPLMADGAARIGILADSDGGIDTTVVGSITSGGASSASPLISPDETRTYTIRRSVLQADPTVDCIIYDDGTQEGGC